MRTLAEGPNGLYTIPSGTGLADGAVWTILESGAPVIGYDDDQAVVVESPVAEIVRVVQQGLELLRIFDVRVRSSEISAVARASR